MVRDLYGTSAHVATFQGFWPSPCTICFVLLVMGLGPRFRDFSSKGSPIVHSALWGVVFCLDFSPFLFFLLLFPCQVFFLYLSIYLFI
jgi:hypothetical protein